MWNIAFLTHPLTGLRPKRGGKRRRRPRRLACLPAPAGCRFEPLEPRLLLSTTFSFTPLGGGKTAFGDFDNDGFVDIFLGGSVFRNLNGNGWETAANVPGNGLWGDYDNDGFLDLFSTVDRGKVFHNDNGQGFTELSVPTLPNTSGPGATWGDFDGDAYLDLYVASFETPGYQPDYILTNNQGQNFSITWQQSGDIDPARGATAADFDQDGDLDIYVSNYRLEQNQLYLNDGTGTFTNVAPEYGVEGIYDGWSWSYGHTIGSAWGDLDDDGDIDLFVGNFSHPDAWQDRSRFYENLGAAGGYKFADRSDGAGLAWQESFATPALGDYDNDGDLDLYFTTVYPGDAPVLYRNDGNWHFTNVTAEAGLGGIGITYRAAWADVDNDGDLDLSTGAGIYINNGTTGNWLKVHLQGDGVNVNRAAIGAQGRITIGNKTYTRQVEGGTGEGNQNDLTMHFGLGGHSGPVTVEITWPDGTTTTRTAEVNQMIDVTYGSFTGDFNGDGNLDIVWRNEATGDNAIWLMNNTTRIGIVDLTDVPNLGWQIAGTGDFTGDGDTDLLWRNRDTGNNYIWQMNGTVWVIGITIPSTPNVSWRVGGTGDFNRDGSIDILWRNQTTGENAIWMMNGTTLVSSVFITPTANLNWIIAGTGDFNQDDHMDILWQHSATGEVAVWLMNGTNFVSAVTLPSTNLDWQVGAVGDINNDGDVDIIWRNTVTGNNAVWLMNGTNFNSLVPLPPAPNQNWQMIGTQNQTVIPNDPPTAAIADPADASVVSGTVTVSIQANDDHNPAGTLNVEVSIDGGVWHQAGYNAGADRYEYDWNTTTALDGGHTIDARATDNRAVTTDAATVNVVVANFRNDFNGDGELDILWRNGANGSNAIWYLTGTTFDSAKVIDIVPDTNWQMAGTGNFNADGQPDIVWRHQTSGQNRIWLMNGSNFVSAIDITTASNTDWRIGAVADLNADGQHDLLWRNRSTGDVAAWLMSGTTLDAIVLLDGEPDLNQFIAEAADFNRDGSPDILWRNLSTGDNTFWLMNGTTVNSVVAADAEADLDWQIGTLGDIDGDTHVDIVWRNLTTGENRAWLMNGTTRAATAAMQTASNLNWQMIGTQAIPAAPPPAPPSSSATGATASDIRARLGAILMQRPVAQGESTSRKDAEPVDLLDLFSSPTAPIN